MSGLGDKFKAAVLAKPENTMMARIAAKRLPPKTDEERARDAASAKRNATKAELLGHRG